MRVLITGASGLVGGRLIQHLLESTDIQVRAASRRKCVWPQGVEAFVTDISDRDSLVDACRDADVVVNLASMRERLCQEDPQEALRVNAGGTEALTTAAVSAGVSRFVQLSTYKVYGNSPSGRITEETPCRPQSHYAITHNMAEQYVRWLHPAGVVLRLANGFGAPAEPATECWDVIVNEMCRQAVTAGQITIRSSGQSWRNFVPMSAVVGALVAGIMRLSPDTYQLGAAQSMQIIDMAQHVARVCHETVGFSPSINVGDPSNSSPDVPLDYRIDKLTAAGVVLGTSFDDEIHRTLLAARANFK